MPNTRTLNHRILFRVGLVLCGYLVLAGFSFFAPGRAHPLREAPADAVVEGLRVWRGENCGSCHAVFGLGGHLGPDAVSLLERRGERHLRTVLEQGAIGMPAFHPRLATSEREAVVAWLAHLGSFGNYPVTRHPPPFFGDLE